MLLPLLMNNLMGSGAGPVFVIVPNVVGQTQLQGTIDLQADLFAVAVGNAYSNTVPAGFIISQDPVAGSSEVQGSTVTIIVSLGPSGASTAGTSRKRQIVTANDIILGALKRINAYAPGESLSQDDAQDSLDSLNELLDSWSTDKSSVYCTQENVLNFVANQYQYTIGNPFSENTFTGTLQAGSNVISNVTVPNDIKLNGDLYVEGTGLQSGVTITGFGSVSGTVTMSAPALMTVTTPQVFSYTVPGDFKADRPLRIHDSFTRITTGSTGLDYPIKVVDMEQYIQIGYKGISAPWPIAVWYNPCYPLGMLSFYQNPSGSGELHLFCDTILTRLETLTQAVNMPQGYIRWLKWALAKELAPEYGKAWTQTMETNWREARDAVKALNMVPTPVSNYDAILVNPRYDAGWILYGGFR